MEAFRRDVALVGKLEEFCSSGDFTSFVAEFSQTHAAKFTDEED